MNDYKDSVPVVSLSSASFDGVVLPLPVEARIWFERGFVDVPNNGMIGVATSAALTSVMAEVVIRGIEAADGLLLGREGELRLHLYPDRGGNRYHECLLHRACLMNVIFDRPTPGMAIAKLEFRAAFEGNEIPITNGTD